MRRAIRRDGVLIRMGRFTAGHPLVVVAAWAAIVAAAVGGFLNLGGALRQGGLFVEGSDSLAAHRIVERAFPDRPDETALLVFASRTLRVEDPRYQRTVEEAAAQAASIPGVTEVTRPGAIPGLVGKDGRTAYAVVGLRGDSGAIVEEARRLLALVRSIPSGPVRVLLTGRPPLSAEFFDAAGEDLTRAEGVGLPVAALVLLVAFGTLIAAGLPLIVAGAALVVGLSLLFLLAQVLKVDPIVENAATMIGLAVSIDYALFMVTRYREEVARGAPGEGAVIRTVATAGRAVLFSGSTVVVGLSGMLLVPVPFLRTMALGPMVVVLMAVAAALTLVPALLRLLGPWVDRGRLPGLRPWRPGEGRNLWARWARGIMRHPAVALLFASALLLVLAAPTLRMALGNPGISSAPADFTSRRGYEVLARSFEPGVLGPAEVVVRDRRGVLTPAVARDIEQFSRLAGQDPAVARVDSYLEIVGDPAVLGSKKRVAALLASPRARAALEPFVNVANGADVAIITVRPAEAPDTPAATDLVRRIRDRSIPTAFGSLETHVQGPTAQNLDEERALVGSIPRVYGLVVLSSFLLLLLVFRSVVIPLKAILVNLLSVGAAFGVLVLVFQEGVGTGLIGVKALPFLDFITPLTVFTALFGLSMDYEVFLLSRIQEEYLARPDNDRAVARGLETTGRTITAAALIMVAVFVAFVSTRLIGIKQIGLGLAVAVLVDATVARVVLVPAAMRLLGRWNWWVPRFLDRVLPRLQLTAPPGGGTAWIPGPVRKVRKGGVPRR